MSNSNHHRASHHKSKDDASKQFDPWIIWVTFRRCWPWALPIGAVLASIAAFTMIKNFVPSYRATYLLEANSDFLLRPGVVPTVKNLVRTEKSLILNPIVLDTVLADPNVRSAPSLSDPLSAEVNLRKNLTIASDGSALRLLVSYRDTNPEAARDVCNAIVDAYLNQRDLLDNERIDTLIDRLGPVIAQWEQKVEEGKRDVASLSISTIGFSPDEKGSVLENNSNWALATMLKTEIANLSVEITVAEAQLAMKTASDTEASGLPSVEPESSVQRRELSKLETESRINTLIQNDVDVIAARQLHQRYEAKIIQFKDSPKQIGLHRDDYKRAQRSVIAALAAIEKAEASALIKATEQLDEALELDYQDRLAENKQNQLSLLGKDQLHIVQLKTELTAKQKLYEEEKSELSDFNVTTAELHFAKEELDAAFQIHKQLSDRVVSIRTERRQNGAVRTLAKATTPRTPIEKLPYKKLMMGSVIALFFPFLFGLLWELRTQRLTDSNMCDKNGLAVIGEIARLPSGTNSTKGRRVFEESIDTLRSSLFLSVETRDTRTIAVVSSMSGEGKSSVSSQLALSIAKATGETVLLIDADLRCPDQHEIFGLEMGPGLSGVLSGTATLAEAADKSLGDLIHVLPAGPLTSSPHRLITPDKMKKFVELALKEYSYVVIDTAPVLSAGEALAVASSVDVSLLCVMRDLSRMENVIRTSRRLEAVGATLAGTVFSGVSARQYAYRYGDYHYASPQTGVTHVS